MDTQTTAGYRLAPQQKHLWQLAQRYGSAAFAAECTVALRGPLDRQRLTAAIQQVIDRYEILRTSLRCPPGLTMPVQLIDEQAEIAIRTVDLSAADSHAQADSIGRIWRELRAAPIADGASALQAALAVLSDADSRLLLRLPALNADQRSLSALVAAIGAAYADPAADLDPPLQYADLAEWLNEALESEEALAERERWSKEALAELLTIKLPFERQSATTELMPEAVAITFDADTSARIAALAEQTNTSIADVLLACWQILLWRLTGQSSLAIGVACDGRNYADLSGVIGVLAKYLPLRCELERQLSLSDLLVQTRDARESLQARQEYLSWEQIRGVDDRSGGPAGFSFGFDWLEQLQDFSAAGVIFSLLEQNATSDRYTVALRGSAADQRVTATLQYDASRCAAADITRLAGQFAALVRNATAELHAAIGELGLLSAAEHQQLVIAFNDTAATFAGPDCVHQVFEQQARLHPDRAAVIYEAGTRERVWLSYAELNARANRLARHLDHYGVGPETVVAICLDRSVEMMVAILAVWKAGGAYVPLDPALPPERLALLIDDTQARAVLTQQSLAEQLPPLTPRVCLDRDWPAIATWPADDPPGSANPENAAYILFTSGSTGRPKGVVIEHRQLHNYVQAITSRLDLPPAASFAVVSTFAADLGNTMIFPALCSGGTLHIIAQERAGDSEALSDYFRRYPIDCLKIVPSHLAALLAGADPGAVLPRRRLVLGGEAAHWDLIARIRSLAPACRVFNHYGPTETTVGVLTYAIPEEQQPATATVPLGRPIANAQVYVLDERMQPVPAWIPGEIYIGGAGVARGYLNRPELTAETFVADPFNRPEGTRPGARLYKTGDLGRFLPDGTIEFLGRIDHQVKIRGYRIELGEIEATLRRHVGVQAAAVIVREDSPGASGAQKQLVAYAVPRPRYAPTIARQPRYILPNNMAIAQINQHETDFFYQQIFVNRTELKHGLTLRDGDTVFDIGANIGLFTLFVHQLYRNVTVYACEPLPPIFDVLRLNAELYGPNTRLFRCGLSNQTRPATFTYYPRSSCQSGYYADTDQDMLVLKTIMTNQQETAGRTAALDDYLDDLLADRSKGEPFTCQLRTLSDLLREQPVERIDLLKIDVEKSEYDVLEGIAPADWSKIRQVVIEAHDIDGQVARIERLLREHGYTIVVEESDSIKGSGLYNIYARRPGHAAHVPAHVDRPLPVLPPPILGDDDLRAWLKQRLPEYMVPSAIVLLDALPLTPNGKLDRQALPAPEQVRSAATFVAPGSPVEQVLAELWIALLGRERVGIHDSFFDLGGHSLLATQLISQIRRIFHVEITLRTIFAAPTVATLAQALIAGEARPGQTEKTAQILTNISAMSSDDVRQGLEQRKRESAGAV